MPHPVVQTAKVATDLQESASLVVFLNGQEHSVKREVITYNFMLAKYLKKTLKILTRELSLLLNLKKLFSCQRRAIIIKTLIIIGWISLL